MAGAVVNMSIQRLDGADLTVRALGQRLVTADILGDGVKISLLDEASNVRRVLTGLLAQLDAIEAKP